MSRQLTMDGGSVAVESVPSTRRVPLSAVQRAIIRHADQNDGIRPVEAGLILHRDRPKNHVTGSAAANRWHGTSRAVGCCPWASSDGHEALKRLERRGYLKRDEQDRRYRPVRPS